MARAFRTSNRVSIPPVLPATTAQGMSYNQYHTPVPKIWQYNLTLQRELGTTMMAQVAYVGSKGWNLNFPVDIDQVPENELSSQDITPGSNMRPYPNYTGLGGSTNNASSNYNSLQAQFQKRLGHGLEFTAAYTWSKFLDSQDSSGWGSSAGSQDYQSSYCVKCNWGPSNFDRAPCLHVLRRLHAAVWTRSTVPEQVVRGRSNPRRLASGCNIA